MQKYFSRKITRKFFYSFAFFLITSFLTGTILFPVKIVSLASSGTILYEKDADKEKPPASVTKVMTLLLIFEALSKKQITLNDTVTVSEHAASMGGSQVFLEPGENQSVDTMIKCIAVSSANDACVSYSHSRN